MTDPLGEPGAGDATSPRRRLNLVFFGSGAFGLPTLERLVQRHHVSLVVSQPDRPAGRGRTMRPTPVAEFAERVGVETIKPADVNTHGVVEQVQSIGADAFVVIAFGQKLGTDLLGRTPSMNLHASLLPKYRGAAPINWAMIDGETETGVSVITLAERMDAGAVLATRSVAIDPAETAGELHDRLASLGPDVILETLQALDRGELDARRLEQDEAAATRAPKLGRADGTVAFGQPADAVRARIHGLTPWPGCMVRIADRLLRLLRVEVAEPDVDAGRTGRLLEDGRVSCDPGTVRLLEVQPAGGRPMPFDDYLRGHPVPAGSCFEPTDSGGR